MHKNKILTLLFYIPHFYIGGVSKVFTNLLSELSKKEIKISIIIGDANESLLDNIECNKNIDIIYLKSKKSSKSIVQVSKLLKFISPDIAIGVQSHAAWTLSIASMLINFKGKIVSWEHTNRSISIKKSNFYTKATHFLISAISNIKINSYICVSNGVAVDLEKILNIDKKKIISIPSPIFNNHQTRSKRENAPSRDLVKFLSVGRLSFEKGLLDLLSAISDLPRNMKWNLTIIGSGPEEGALRKYVDSHNLQSYVTFTGHLNNTKEFYMNSDVFVLTSHYEGLPTVLVEASQYGLPIVSTDCESGPREIIINGLNGLLVPVGDISAIKFALLKMLENHAHYSNSYKYVDDYEVSKASDRFYNHFLELI